MTFKRARSTLFLLTLFLCTLKVSAAFPEEGEHGEAEAVTEKRIFIKSPDSVEANKTAAEALHQPAVSQVADHKASAHKPRLIMEEDTETTDDAQPATLEQTLLAEQRRLEALESELENNLNETHTEQQENIVEAEITEISAQTLLTEQQRLEELESAYNDTLNELNTQSQQEITDEEDATPETPEQEQEHVQTLSSEEQQPEVSGPESEDEAVPNEIDSLIAQLQQDYSSIGNDENLKTLFETLSAEKEKLFELELEYKKNFDEALSQTQQISVEEEDTLSNQHLESTLREESLASPSRVETDGPVPIGGLKPEGNVDLLGTADGLYKLAQYEAALQAYQSINADGMSEQDNLWILYQTANCYRNLKQFENAQSSYREILTKHPNTYLGNEARWYLEDTSWWIYWHEKLNATLDKDVTEMPFPSSNAEGKQP